MLGKNPIRKPIEGDGTDLEVKEIYSTIQGEGLLAGIPAIFIRLGGCNLACSFCDTEFESFKIMKLHEILSEVKNGREKLVVITGGEPFRQPIELLCSELLNRGYQVQIETNGTLYRPVDKRVMIICSPKYNTKIKKEILERAAALKFIISAENRNYTEVSNTGYNVPIYVQPMDEYDEIKNKKNLDLAIKLSRENGYRLSLQIHKILGLP